MSCPATRAVPELGGMSVVSMRRLVVLPAPLGPRNATSSPRLTSMLRSRTASPVLPLTLKVLVRSCVEMTVSVAMQTTVQPDADSFCPQSVEMCRYGWNDDAGARSAQPAPDAQLVDGPGARHEAPGVRSEEH